MQIIITMVVQTEKYLIFALSNYKRFDIPNFGSFELVECPAEVHPVRHEFRPPIVKVVFTHSQPDCKSTISHFAADAALSESAAEKILNDYSNFLKDNLQKSNTYSIDKVGTLTVDSVGKISFAAAENDFFNADFFALPEFSANIAEKEKPVVVPKAPKKKHKFLKFLLWFILIIAVCGAVAYFVFPEQSKKIINEFFPTCCNSECQADTSLVVPVDTIQIDTVATPVDTIVQDSAMVDSSSIVQPQAVVNVNNSYFVVCACFRDLGLAEKQVERLKTNGYNALVCGQTTAGLHVVAYQACATEAEAKTAMNSIKMKENRTDLWIFRQK